MNLPGRLRGEATAHIQALCQKHRITLHWRRDGLAGEAHVRTRQVWCPTINTALDYAMGLHEIGHVTSATARMHTKKDFKALKGAEHEIITEAAAWGWAIDHAEKHILNRMSGREWRSIGLFWLTYLTRSSYVTEAEAQRVNPTDGDGYPIL